MEINIINTCPQPSLLVTVKYCTSNKVICFICCCINSSSSSHILVFFETGKDVNIQGVSKKRYFLGFLSFFSSRGRILLFRMCFGIRISSPFHLATQTRHFQNLKCPKNAKNACADLTFIPALQSEAVSSLLTAGQ